MGIFDKLRNAIGGGDGSDEADHSSSDEGSGPECINCQQPLAGSELTVPWEDGDNADGYVTCRHCGAQNFF